MKKDWVRAYALMTRASAAGISAASSSLAQMDKYIPLDQRQRGLTLARSYETSASNPQIAAGMVGDGPPPRPAVTTEDLPPSDVGAPPVRVTKPVKMPPVKIAVAPKPAPPVRMPPAVVTAPPSSAPSGNWKVQLAAFGDAGKASGLWNSLRSRIGALGPYRAFVVQAGPITRLQAGPLASRAAADKLCASVKESGQACIPVAP